MIHLRNLQREEIPLIWTIDRSEIVDACYARIDGTLVLQPTSFVVRGWAPDRSETDTPIFEECFDRGCWFCGLFTETRLVGIAVLDTRWIGRHGDTLQLMFLHVSNGYRDQGNGRHLFELARDEARRRGAKRLYVSATPTAHTVHFYLRAGCSVLAEPDPELFALEPEDIHLECMIDQIEANGSDKSLLAR